MQIKFENWQLDEIQKSKVKIFMQNKIFVNFIYVNIALYFIGCIMFMYKIIL
jgi:hypothetical protein